MPDVSVLDVRLYDESIGTLTHLQGDRTIFAFNEAYVENPHRPTLSLSFKDDLGGLITKSRPTQRVVPPFFSNLLPEGGLRRYLAERAGVNQQREFFLLWVLGLDLPGALSIHPAAGEGLPPGNEEDLPKNAKPNALRFSLAGVQLKFSAFQNAGKGGGLTIPAEGVGGSWIVKLPSQQYTGVPENEFSMMTIAGMIGMEVPIINLVDLDAIAGIPEGVGELRGQALAISRFDRSGDGPIHTEDFAQVFGVFPDDKYRRANYANVARVIGTEAGNGGAAEFIRRLVFSALIGNGDMHLKNWSLIYPDRRSAALSPAYDLVSTIPYIKGEDTAALNYSRTKKMAKLDTDELRHLAAKALLPEKLVVNTAAETVRRFRQVWEAEKTHLPLADTVVKAIDAHAPTVPLFSELA
ncbi:MULTISPECIES: type II toxin-antitoxin system HipA family toxin [unclassified Mesorhizobium]|uniref:type II toxin-antitoxin system HipA family toxin n=1 Tax=unclassified Mesorhizobium TaxID=325217 RepID=UPI00112C5F62|nr:MULTISPECIES: HipA domain-containing protein [unclassified Mesorhizobium]MBZ9739931.1 HipA domain-containing protein [Mesorhizobium sp. CO1-1-4]MBZ9805744.1 HipA domain-containing protein [Mesorhizobium sp. ES1-6]TPL88568.1 type II toxin-antitoxin system HipA family toxin [Mesorhizobium sp. B2-3-12]